ncbi:MAG TPA: RagB/SusD family nutrient uptake outer membrane protein [Gemmatimonadaceae bacterium]|nr:RagB/SusD family nutrient uptake outer membrane protein [Gemmatimonadaceae bacterium]
MIKRTVALLAGLTLLGACADSTGVPDLNNVSSSLLQSGLNRSSVQLLATGLLNSDRGNYGGDIIFPETMARDLYRIDSAEPRFITELIGLPADPGGFVGGGMWTGWWTEIRAANNLIDNIGSAKDLSAAEQAATVGMARTFKALSYYRLLEMRDSLGIPVDVDHDINTAPAPFVCKPNVLAYISALLDSAYANLQTAGNTPFPFTLPGGFTESGDYSTPAAFAAFNRGLKGKVEVYRGLDHTKPNAASFAAAISALTTALGPVDGSHLSDGPYYIYSTAPGEQTNPLVDAAIHLNPSVADSLQAGDMRGVQITKRSQAATGQGVTTNYDYTYAIPSIGSNLTRPMVIMSRAEMVLLRAQAEIESNQLAAATADLNIVRTNLGGLPAYATFATQADARNALLYEKRYTLLFQGAQRLVDLRAYGLLSAKYHKAETATDVFQTALPIPTREVDGRGGTVPTPTCN